MDEIVSLSELAEYCKSIDINCDICTHQKECKKMLSSLEDISPYGLLKKIKEDKVSYQINKKKEGTEDDFN